MTTEGDPEEQKRAQRITDLIEQLRKRGTGRMERWNEKNKFHTLSSMYRLRQTSYH
jgi:hypothetical protein